MSQAASRDPPAKGIGTMADAPQVFLSYSHDSDEHAARVLVLADALCDGGINVILDRYVHPAPAEGWPRWMERNLDAADFVLMVCTATYRRRVRGEEESGQGTGVRWEGTLIYNRIAYGDPAGSSRFIPILLPGSEPTHIPDPVRGHSYYRLATFDRTDPGYEALYRHLTGQPATPRPDLGSIQILPPIPRPQAVPGPLPPSGGPWWNVSYPRNPNFTGREAILTQLEAALASGMPAALSQAIAGLGGVGKTQTAVEYAYRHRERYRAVLWVRADTETSLVSGYRELAEVLGLPEKDARDSNEVGAAVRRWLGREPGYLLILDNADDPALVKPFLPPTPTGHILLTSRAHNFDRLNIRRPIALSVLEPDEALAFLGKRTGREGPLDSTEQAAARTLAGELGYLPLALEQAAAYMKEHEETFSVYLDAYREERLKLLDEMGPVTGEYPETVRTTWKRSFDAVAEASPASIAMLRLSAFFAPDAIPYELILEGASQLGEPLAPALAFPAGGDHALNKLLTPLARHSLVRRDPEARIYSIHRLVQAVLLDELTAATRKDLAGRAVKALDRTFPDVEYPNWPRCERLVPHALAARGWIESEALRIPEATRLLTRAGYYLYLRARYAEAEPLSRRALAIREAALGLDHPDTAASLNNLALLLCDQGRYGEAEPLLRRALAIREAALGPDHPHTAWSLGSLAELLRDQGRLGEAEPVRRRALAISEAALGPDHPDTARSIGNLAELLRDQGRLEEAEPLYRQALAIHEAALGLDHPDTATSLNNLALLLWAQGWYGEAEPLLRRALAISEAALGPDHPHTAQSLNNLAGLLCNQGRPGEAEPLSRRALAIREAALGPDHPLTAQSLNNLAMVLCDQGRPGEAEPLSRRRWRSARRRWAPTTPTRPRASAAWRSCSGTRAGSGRRSRCAAGRWQFPRRRWAPTTPTRPVASATWRGCSATRAGPGRRSRCTVGRWRSTRRRWAPTTPTRPPASTTWRCCSATRAGPGRRSHCRAGRWRSARRRWAPTTPTRPRASAAWRSCSGTRAGSGRRSRCAAGRWQFPRRRWAPTTPTRPVASATWRGCSATRAGPGRRSRCTVGRWRSTRRRWAPTTPTRPPASTTWRCCSATRAGPGRRSRCTVGRWRSARRRWAPTTPTRPKASTTWRGCSGPRAGPGRRSRCAAGRWRSVRRRWAPTTPTRPKASTT